TSDRTRRGWRPWSSDLWSLRRGAPRTFLRAKLPVGRLAAAPLLPAVARRGKRPESRGGRWPHALPGGRGFRAVAAVGRELRSLWPRGRRRRGRADRRCCTYRATWA